MSLCDYIHHSVIKPFHSMIIAMSFCDYTESEAPWACPACHYCSSDGPEV